MKRQGLVNIYHFIRKSTYEDGIFTQEDFDTLKSEMDLLKQHQLPATYALKYDALMDERYTALIKSMIDEKDEVAAWWEITEEMARKAGVTWKGKDVIDLHVKAGYSLAYLPEERKALLDVYMEDFKAVYGAYPKTIGSWVMDIVTFEYAKARYGLVGGALCRDQRGIDGFTLWGGYFNGAYYPSKVNEYMPAQTNEMQLDLPIFRLLGPDPIYNFESGIRDGADGIYTLEPAWITGQDEKWVTWLLGCVSDEEQVGYGYTQVGQENSYIWGTMGDAYEMQIRHLAQLRKENKVRVESLRDSSVWFKQKYALTPPTTYTASKDWNEKFGLNTTWYSSRFYRMSLLWDQGEFSIRDLYVFNEDYPSRYLNDYITHNESVFDALPLLDTHNWSTKEKRASIDFVEAITGEKLKGEAPVFLSQEDDENWYVQWKLNEAREMSIVCTQNQMHFEMLQEGGTLEWMMRMNTLPTLEKVESQCILCRHENFAYEVHAVAGTFEQVGDEVWIRPEGDQIILEYAQKGDKDQTQFYTEMYLKEGAAFDARVEAMPVIAEEKLKDIKLIKPFLPEVLRVKGYDEVCYCEMKNLNEIGQIYYTLDGSEPTNTSMVYQSPLAITGDTLVKARCFAEGRPVSDLSIAQYFNTLEIKGITSPTVFDGRTIFNRQGIEDLIDGKKGTTNFVDGAWLGTLQSLEAVVDLGESREIKGVEIGFLHSRRTGLCYPDYVEYSVSEDGEQFEVFDKQEVFDHCGEPDLETKDVVTTAHAKGRYVKVFAKRHNYFIFADQIIVKG
ncbi:MAG: FN3 associated domain-containing protein [Cellulosilyticaceae bacterium]